MFESIPHPGKVWPIASAKRAANTTNVFIVKESSSRTDTLAESETSLNSGRYNRGLITRLNLS